MAGALRYSFSAGKTCDGCNNGASPISPAEGASAMLPFWASWIAVIAACALSFAGFHAAMRS